MTSQLFSQLMLNSTYIMFVIFSENATAWRPSGTRNPSIVPADVEYSTRKSQRNINLSINAQRNRKLLSVDARIFIGNL